MPRIEIDDNTVERIRFYRSGSLAQILTVLAPLAFGVVLSLAMLIVAIAQGRCWLFDTIADFSPAVAVIATAGILALFAWAAVAQVRSRARRNPKDS